MSDFTLELQDSPPAEDLFSTPPHPESNFSNLDSLQEGSSCDAQSCSGDDELLSQSSVETNNAQDNAECPERLRDENNSLESPKFYFGTLRNVSDFISESQDSLSTTKNIFSTSPHSKFSLQNLNPSQGEAHCSAQVYLCDNEKLPSQSLVETNNAQDNAGSLERLRDAKKNSSKSPKFYFGALRDVSDFILGLPVAPSPAEDLFSSSSHPESSLPSIDSPQEDAPCNAEDSLGVNEELPLQSSVESNSTQCNAESPEGFSQFYFGAVQNASDCIMELEGSPPPVTGVLPTSLRRESSLSSLDSLLEEASRSAEDCLSDYEELLFQSSVGTITAKNNVESLEGLRNIIENSVPLNLYQDSWSSKFSTLPSRHRTAVENLISQIGYQINYFSPKFKKKSQSSHMTLNCKICWKFVSVTGAEKHVCTQEHLENLTQRCKETGKILTAAAIDEENWEFLDFKEGSQRFQCNLCGVKLSNSISSWYEHVQTNPHLSKLKPLKREVPVYPVSALNSVSSSKCDNNGASSLKDVRTNVNGIRQYNVPSSNAQAKLKENSFRVVAELLSRKDKRRLQHVQYKLQDDINYFKPTYDDELGRLCLICKVCKVSVLLQNITSHVSDIAHSKNLKKFTAAQYNVNKLTSALFSAANKKIIKDLTHKFKDFITYFEPFENVSDQLHFICKICAIVLLPKDVRMHIYSSTHFNDAKKNLSNVNITAAQNNVNSVKSCLVVKTSTETKMNEKSCVNGYSLNNEKVIKNLTNKLGDYMNYFEPFLENESNELRFTCNVCSVPLIPKDVRSHIYVTRHLNNVRKSFSDVKLEALSTKDQKSVKKLLKQFNCQLYVFQLKCDKNLVKLFFVCQVCNATVIPEDVKSHISSEKHSTNLLTNPFSLTFESLNESNKEIVKELAAAIQDIQSFNLVYKIGTEELRFNCKFCCETLTLHAVERHVQKLKHSEAVSEQASEQYDITCVPNLKRQIFEYDARNSATLPPKAALNSVHVPSSSSPTLNQNLTVVSYDSLSNADKKLVKKVIDDSDTSIMYFTILYSTKKLYLMCRLCDLKLEPENVTSHVTASCHLRNWRLNSSFKNFLLLECSTRHILRRLFHETDGKLSDSLLLSCIDGDGGEPGFVCKFCKEFLFSDSVVHHLQSEEHRKHSEEGIQHSDTAGSMKASQQCKSKNSLDSEPLSRKILTNSNPVGTIKDIHSSGLCDSVLNPNFASVVDSIEGVSKEQENRTLRSDFNYQIKSNNEILFDCHSCNSCRIKAEESNDLNREAVRKLFITCHDQSRSVLSNSNQKVLNMLHDNIREKLSSFYFTVNILEELCFKCKFCSLILHPGTVEKHVNLEKHLKYSQLSDVFSGFEDLSDGRKNIVRKLYDEMGGKINDYDLTVSFNFICKLCGASLSPEIVANHDSSEGHLKHSLSHSSGNHAVSVNASRNSPNLKSDFLNHEEKMQDTVGCGDFNRLPQNILDQKFDFSDNCNETIGRKIFKKMTQRFDDEDHGSVGKTSLFASISEQNLKFLVFEKSVKCYQCILCKVRLSNSVNSWIKHFEKTYHILKSLKPNIFLNPVNAVSSTDAHKKVTRMKTRNKRSVLRSIENKLKDDMKHFELFDESGKFIFICKVCGELMLASDVTPHASTEAHKKNLETNLSDLNLETAQNNVDSALSSFGLLSSSVPSASLSVDEKVCESKETQVESMVSDTSTPLTSTENDCPTQMPTNLLTGCCAKLAKAVVTGKRNNFSASRDVISSATAQNNVLTTAANHLMPELMCIIPNPHNQEYAIYLNDTKSNELSDFSSTGEVESKSMLGVNSLSCTVCRLDVVPEDIAIHVNTQKHVINSELSVNVCFKTLSDFYEEVAGMFTGNVSHENSFEIFYELPQNELCFYCKRCNIMLHAESLENHVSHSHSNDFTVEFERNRTSSEVDQPNLETGGDNQSSKLFICKPCNHQVHFKDIADHVDSKEHLKFLEIIGNFLEFDSFIAYKERVVATLSCEPLKNPNDFEFFRKIRSPKLSLYCKPCQVLLQPESLNHHIKYTKHRHNSVARYCSVLFPEGSLNPEIVAHEMDSQIDQSDVLDDQSSSKCLRVSAL